MNMSIMTSDMKNIAVINALMVSKFSTNSVFEGKSAIAKSFDFAQDLPDIDKIIYLIEDSEVKEHLLSEISVIDDVPVDFEFINSKDVSSLFKILRDVSLETDNIFYFYADCPFLSNLLAKKLYDSHIKYFAEYTFADGYPYGLTPEVIRSSIVDSLLKLSMDVKGRITRKTIFDVIKRDINAFDIETQIAPKDLRLLRVELSTDSKRNFIVSKNIHDAGGRDVDEIVEIVDRRRELLRSLPAYISIQIVEKCSQYCSYCPYGIRFEKNGGVSVDIGKEMSIEEFRLILDKIEDFCSDAVIDISLWGEPALHSSIIEIIFEVMKRDSLSLLIETSGVGWKEFHLEKIKDILEQFPNNPPTWIVSLDAFSQAVYEKIRGKGFRESIDFAEKLLGLFPGNTYIQAVRMVDNENELEDFYRYWKEKTENVIIQKYDNFCGLLPDRRVTDLSPLKRFPCWHLQRDMYILLDGTVPMCREDFGNRYVLGNVFSDEIEEIWGRGNKYYLDHLKGEYPEICKRCDEYYTYNF